MSFTQLYGLYQNLKDSLDDFVVFTDILGGTPCNVITQYLLEGEKFKVYAGMNMPMVIAFINGEMINDGKVNYIKEATDNVLNVNALLNK